MDTHYDIAIIGGGMVGGACALALKNTGLRILVIDALPIQQRLESHYDTRSVALSRSSIQILEALGLWERLKCFATPIKQIHVSDRGHFGLLRFSAEQAKVFALGYVVEAHAINSVFNEVLATLPHVTLLQPAALTAIEQQREVIKLILDNDNKTFTAKLAIGADGQDSTLRRLFNIDVSSYDYHQVAMVANVTPAKVPNGIAYERFTRNGPMALLPLTQQRYALIWTTALENQAYYLGLEDDEFLRQLQETFGYRLGRFLKVGKRSCFPLKLIKAKQQIAHRMVLLGNSAHTLHPIAGQGLNLALRDVAVLVDHIQKAKNQDIGSELILKKYLEARSSDQNRVIGATDKLVKLFAQSSAAITLARNTGLIALDIFDTAKEGFARFAMGVNSPLPDWIYESDSQLL